MSRAADTTMYKVRERVAQHACAHAHHPLCSRAQGVEEKLGARRNRTGGRMGGRACGTCQMRQAADAALNPKAVPAVARSERATHPLAP
jgi:hypothetical protein